MQQTSLNLMAIGVFTMTLFCLVGPLLHVSPFIPAGVTFAVMGLAAIDTWSLENKGVVLLLDSLSPQSYRERVIHHEAGHFLAAYLMELPIEGYALTAWEALRQGHAGSGGVRFDTPQLSSEDPIDNITRRWAIDRYCTVWLAGIAAEQQVYGDAQGGEEDRQQVRSAFQLVSIPLQQHQQKERWALLQAKNLLQQHESAYQALVEAMTKRASVDECCQTIQAHLPAAA